MLIVGFKGLMNGDDNNSVTPHTTWILKHNN